MIKLSSLILFLFASIALGCQYFQQKENGQKVPVARSGSTLFYLEDLEGLIPGNISTDDSVKLAEKYVNDWIKKQLMVDKAKEEMAINEAEIERKVQDYQYALIVHEFEKLYVNSHLNLSIDPAEIEAYYKERADNFVLKQNILKCLFVQIPKSAPGISQLRRNIRSYPSTNKEDISEYCLQYAIKTFLDDSLWINFDEVIIGTPLEGLSNKIQFLQNTAYSETSDEDFIYYLRILDYKISDQISPLEFIREDIQNIIISKRKLALKKELEQAIYEEALSKNSFEIYRN